MSHGRHSLAILAAALLVLPFVAASTAVSAPATGRITGIGGVFFKSKDPKALAAWYRDVLGLDVQSWGGALLDNSDPARAPKVVWTPFKASTDYFEPSTREFMLNFAVDDLDAIAARLKAKGVEVHLQPPDDNGRFGWIVDPDGTKIELWQPKHP